MPADMEIPKSMAQRLEEAGDVARMEGKKMEFPADSKKWYDRKLNEEAVKKYTWSNGPDPRFPQQNISRYCWTYYLDFQRCLRLKGEDYAPCQYFKNVYEEVCPGFWIEKWDTWVAENRFPAYFDR